MKKDQKKYYDLPGFLEKEKISVDTYNKWLHGRAESHLRRDRKKASKSSINFKHTVKDYRDSIHDAVMSSKGYDFYTGEYLEWKKLGKDLKKKKHSNYPTVDHFDGYEKANFRICSWKINDMKNDMSFNDFIEACRQVLKHSENKS